MDSPPPGTIPILTRAAAGAATPATFTLTNNPSNQLYLPLIQTQFVPIPIGQTRPAR